MVRDGARRALLTMRSQNKIRALIAVHLAAIAARHEIEASLMALLKTVPGGTRPQAGDRDSPLRHVASVRLARLERRPAPDDSV